METKAIKTFREQVEDRWNSDDRAAFAMVTQMKDETTAHMELYCEGNFDVMISAILEEIADLIVSNSEGIEEMRHVSMGISRDLHRLCNEKWATKTKKHLHFAVLDGGLQ